MSNLYHGSSKVTSLCQELLNNLKHLAKQSESMSKFMLEPGSGRDWNQGWHYELKLNPWSTGETHEITFSRAKELDQQYDKIFNTASPGTDGDMKAVKLQAAYLQAMERAFNLRHATSVRCEAFSAGRRKGQADANGPLIGPTGVQGYIENIIKRSQV
jgi:hypothetical protein